MPENTKKNDSQKSNELIDLSSLVGMTFGPSWSDSKIKTERSEKVDRGKDEQRSFRPRPEGRRFEGQQRDRRPGVDRRPERIVVEVFQPVIDVSFYPEDEPFLALIKAIRTSCKTYELFELAHLILEKPERFVAVISPKRTAENSFSKLYTCPVDSMLFESEEQAIGHTLKNYITNFFDVEEVEVEKPKGSFPVINRCGFTGELLGPPNYHRYQELVKEHYANNLSNVPYERFLSKIESVKDEELIQAWIEKMSKSKRYTLKDMAEEGEKPIFHTWDEARAYLISKRKKDLVRESNSIRLHGASLEKMPKGDLRRSVETALKVQRDFPLDTANNIRGRLRRMNLAIYKKGSKGVTYVCAVKRKFRQEGIKFTDNLQKLIEFIAKHPNCLANRLPELYLGIKQQVAIPNLEAGKTVEESPTRTPEQQAQVRQLMLDLRWLVSEGYVTEYGNGALFTPQVSDATVIEEKDEETTDENPMNEESVVQEKIPVVKKKTVNRTKETTREKVALQTSTETVE